MKVLTLVGGRRLVAAIAARSHRVAAARLAAETRPRRYGSIVSVGPMVSTDVPANKLVGGDSARPAKSCTEQRKFKRKR